MSYPNLTTKIVKKTKRRARGTASGRGGTSGRGNKGQKARTGSKHRPFFEGGSLELFRRLPSKRGFDRFWVAKPAVINIKDMAKFEISEVVNLENLKAKKIIPAKSKSFKILSAGEIDRVLTIACDQFSALAKEKLQKAKCRIIDPNVKPKS